MKHRTSKSQSQRRLLTGAVLAAGLSAAAQAQISQIGRVRVQTPTESAFVLSATMPLEEGTFSATDAGILKFLDSNGALIRDTQIDVVERYPDPADGASVVSLTARVQNPTAGTYQEYDVIQVPAVGSNEAVLPTSPSMQHLYDPTIGGTDAVPSTLSGVLANKGSVILVAYDPGGNEYRCRPFRGNQGKRMYRLGSGRSTLRTFEVMKPVRSTACRGDVTAIPTSNATAYPHLFGVHSVITTLKGEDTALLDFRFSNGMVDQTASTLDDNLARIYFDRVEILVPDTAPNWTVSSDLADPFAHQPGEAFETRCIGSTTYRVFHIVKSLSNPDLLAYGGEMSPSDPGKAHTMRTRGQFVRHLALHPSASSSAAEAYLHLDTQGFAIAGTVAAPYPNVDDRFASWWNGATDNYYPQNVRLPDLDFLASTSAGALALVRNELSSSLALMRNSMMNNQPFTYGTLGLGGNTSTTSRYSLGWSRPFGHLDGNNGGGIMVTPLWGERVAYASSQDGLRLLRHQHRSQVGRHPVAAYYLNGQPFNVVDFEITPTTASVYERPDRQPEGSDIVSPGPATAYGPTQYVINNNLQPYYQQAGSTANNGRLSDFEPQNFAHISRFANYPLSLVYLMDDVLSRDCIRMEGASGMAHASNYTTSTSVGSIRKFELYTSGIVANRGLNHDRTESWIEWTTSAANALALVDAEGDTFRGIAFIWADELISAIEAGATTPVTDRETGKPGIIIYSDDSNGSKPFTACGHDSGGGNNPLCTAGVTTRDRLMFHSPLVNLGMRCLQQSFDVSGSAAASSMDDFIWRLANGIVSEMAWDENGCVPHHAQAVSSYETLGGGAVARDLYSHDPDLPLVVPAGGGNPLPPCSETAACGTPDPSQHVTLSIAFGVMSAPTTADSIAQLARIRGAMDAVLYFTSPTGYCNATTMQGTDTYTDMLEGLRTALEDATEVQPFNMSGVRASSFSMRSGLLGLVQELLQ